MKSASFTLGSTLAVLISMSGCQPQPVTSNVANANSSNANASISNLNTSNANSSPVSESPNANEPEKYQALVKLNIEALGEQRNASIPPISAIVARNGNDRRMEFTLPTGEKVIYLDTAGSNYVILPNRKQYAELNKESVGFEVRRLMMPEQIVNQVKGLQGVEKVGQEELNGRKVEKYRYAATTDTQSRAGQVGTESFLIVDSETGLPLRSEVTSVSQNGGNVQGYKGLKMVTEMSDINTSPDPSLFTVPQDYAKIDPEQVKAQATLIFNALASLISTAVQQHSATPTVSPTVMR